MIDKQKVVEAYLSNPKCEEVGKQFGIGRESVRRILNAAGVKMKRGPRSKKPVIKSEDQDKLFNDHLYLIKIALKKINASYRAKLAGLEVDDLISVGMIGLWRASVHFDPSKGNKFSTPAFQAIKGQMYEAIELARFGRRKRSEDLLDHSRFVTYNEYEENDHS